MLFGCLHQLINDTKENDTIFLVQFLATKKKKIYDFLSTKCFTGDAYWPSLPMCQGKSVERTSVDACGPLPSWGKIELYILVESHCHLS